MSWYNSGTWDGLRINPDLREVLAELCWAVNEREGAVASKNAIAGLSRTSGTAQLHGAASLTIGDQYIIRGADQSDYNGRKIITANQADVLVSSITRSGSTATCTTGSAHNRATGDYAYISGANQTEYNGLVQVTVTSSTVFTYTVSGTPATPATGASIAVKGFSSYTVLNSPTNPATGTIEARKPSTKFTYNEAGAKKVFPRKQAAVSGITRSGGTATVTTSSAHGLIPGESVTISGANETDYNGTYTATITGTTTFTYTVSGSPSTPATGTIILANDFDGLPVNLHVAPAGMTATSMSQSGGTATVYARGHGFEAGDYVNISGAAQSEYNGAKTVTAGGIALPVSGITRSGTTATITCSSAHNLSTGDIVTVYGCTQTQYNITTAITAASGTTLTYTVSGSPATPATGSPGADDMNRFRVAIDAAATSPATGTINIKGHRQMVYRGVFSAGTATVHSFAHGFSVGDYVEVWAEQYSTWRFCGTVATITTNSFTVTGLSGLDAEIWFGTASTIWCAKKVGVRKVIEEIRTAIEGLFSTDTTTANVLRFVTNSAPYTTNMTLSALLGAGSYGSSWLSLNDRPIDTLSDVLLQIKDALDNLVYVTALGDAAFGSGVGFYDVSVPAGTQESVWDDAVAGIGAVTAVGYLLFYLNHPLVGKYQVWIYSTLDVLYTMPFIHGTFVAGSIFAYDSHNMSRPGATLPCDSFTITDSDGDTYAADVASGDPIETVTTAKTSVFFAAATKTLTYTIDTVPDTNPFDPASVPSKSDRRFVPWTTGTVGIPALRVTRQLTSPTDLTYG